MDAISPERADAIVALARAMRTPDIVGMEAAFSAYARTGPEPRSALSRRVRIAYADAWKREVTRREEAGFPWHGWTKSTASPSSI